MKKIFLILIMTAVLFAQDKLSNQREEYNFAPKFYVDLLNKVGETSDKNLVDLYLKIPYSNLQFVKHENSFKAGFSANVLVYDESGKRMLNSISWEEKISLADYNSSISSSSFNISFKQMELEPGSYLIKSVVEDFESKKMFYVDVKFVAKQFLPQLDICDILLIAKKVEQPGKTQLIPNVEKVLNSDANSLSFYYEVYTAEKDSLQITYNIFNRLDELVYSQKNRLDIVAGTNVVQETIDSLTFGLGNYKLVINILNEENKVVVSTAKNFYSKLVGLPSSIVDLTVAIEQTRYIASAEELSYMEDAENFDDKLIRFKNFWKSKDPDPSTDRNEILLEYYGRVNYANQKFANVFEGWRTDMGMIYIILGPPDYIERHPFDSGSKPYEIWSYHNISRSFVFVDYTGFGDYRLMSQDYKDLSRFRY